MSSPITLSGFNDIDFNAVLNAIMQQESQPLATLQSRQSAMQSRANTFSTFVTKASTLQSAAEALSDISSASSYTATSNDATAVAISAGSSAVAGRYEVVVSALARAQVMASDTSIPDSDTTIVATGGTLTIGGYDITLAGSVTLKGLATAINSDSDAPVRASVVQDGSTSYRLVLTAKSTGAANAFDVINSLTGGSGIAFHDEDGDLISGDDPEDNAVEAADAELEVNNIPITSASNTLDSVIPGSTITLYKEGTTVTIDIAEDAETLKTKLQTFVTAYNDFVKFANDQAKSAIDGHPASIGRDPLLRQLRAMLRGSLTSEYATGGTFTFLAQVGVQLTQSGTLEIDSSDFDEAVSAGTAEVATLLAGTSGTPGALASIGTMLDEYTRAGGILFDARDQLTSSASRLDNQIATMEARLALRRLALQQEFAAADAAMTRLKNQSGSLGTFGSSL